MMKKTLITLSLIVFSLSLFAGGQLKVKSGNTSVLKQNSVATLEMDFSETIFGKKENFNTWCGADYESRVELMNETFYNSFNAQKWGMKISKDAEAAYKIVVKWTKFDHVIGGMVWGQMYMEGYGTIDVIDLSTGKSVLSFEIKKDRGKADFVENDRFVSLIECVVKDMAKLVK